MNRYLYLYLYLYLYICIYRESSFQWLNGPMKVYTYTYVCWCPPRCGAPLWWARAPCAAPPCGGFLPRVLVPPRGVVASTETIVMTAERLQR